MSVYQRIETIVRTLLSNLYERDEALRLTLLAALSAKSIFFLGPPGVAKSMIGRRIALAFKDARFFEYLMGRFSTPDELFGPISIARLKQDDSYTRNIDGFLPTADIVFLDEIWKASPPIQNSLLSVLNERLLRNGNELIRIPLKCFIGASNEIKPDDTTRAFWDRFLIRLNIGPVKSAAHFKALLESSEDGVSVSAAISEEEWAAWIQQSRQLGLAADLLGIFTDIRQQMQDLAEEDDSYYISDRRWKQIAELLRTSAFFHDRSEADILDSFIMPHCLWNDPAQDITDIFNNALRKWAFTTYTEMKKLKAEILSFKQALSEAAYRNEKSTLLEPRKYDGEYLRFIPDNDSDKEYRIWAEDLEGLDERGELEFFVYQQGQFVEMAIYPMKWAKREGWELEGSMGHGRIECSMVTATKMVAVSIPADMFAEFKQTFRKLTGGLEKKIADFNEHVLKQSEEAKRHLFLPQKNNKTLELAAEDKRQILEELLSDLLLEGEKLGLSDVP